MRLATSFAALFAMLLQAFIVQTHVHPAAFAFAAGIERADVSQDGTLSHAEVSAPDAHAFGCPICHALASNSASLTDAAAVAHAETARTEATALAIALAPRAHTHSWRSRAPPSHLSA